MNKLLSILLITILLLTGCKDVESGKPVVTVSVYPLGLIVEQLAGDSVDVNIVYPKGADIHNYEPTSQDMAKITESDIVFFISNEEDPYIANLAIDDTDTNYVSIIEDEYFLNNVDSDLYDHDHDEHEEEDEHNHDLDPHLWVSPKELKILANVIKIHLEDIVDSEVLNSNLDLLLSELDLVDVKYSEFAQSQTTPIIVSHDAYSYLHEDYGIEFINLYGKFHDDEPTSSEIAEVIDLIVDNQISTIYVDENSINLSVVNQIANESNATVEVLLTLSTESDIVNGMTLTDALNYNLEQMEKSQ